jgi:hypothetical protein
VISRSNWPVSAWPGRSRPRQRAGRAGRRARTTSSCRTPVAPVLPPAGKKIEVAEFFWYECPHCNAFEPLLEPWARKLPADVAFRRCRSASRPPPGGAEAVLRAGGDRRSSTPCIASVCRHPRAGPAPHRAMPDASRGHRPAWTRPSSARRYQVLRRQHQGNQGAPAVRGLQDRRRARWASASRQGRYLARARPLIARRLRRTTCARWRWLTS